jgi:hypothetical protein
MYSCCSSSLARASSRSLLARVTSLRSDLRMSLRAEETSSLSPIATPSRRPTTSAMKTAASDSA